MCFFYNGGYVLAVGYHLGLGMCYIHEDGLYDLWNDIYITFTMLFRPYEDEIYELLSYL